MKATAFKTARRWNLTALGFANAEVCPWRHVNHCRNFDRLMRRRKCAVEAVFTAFRGTASVAGCLRIFIRDRRAIFAAGGC